MRFWVLVPQGVKCGFQASRSIECHFSLPTFIFFPSSFYLSLQGRRSGPKSGGGGGAEAEGRDECGGEGVGGVFDKEYQSAPVNCKADRLSAFCASRAKMSAIPTRHDKTTKGDNGHFRTLRAITYKKILNKSNAILAACLHLLATFGLECWAFACKKKTICKKVGGGWGGQVPPLPLPVCRLCITFLFP